MPSGSRATRRTERVLFARESRSSEPVRIYSSSTCGRASGRRNRMPPGRRQWPGGRAWRMHVFGWRQGRTEGSRRWSRGCASAHSSPARPARPVPNEAKMYVNIGLQARRRWRRAPGPACPRSSAPCPIGYPFLPVYTGKRDLPPIQSLPAAVTAPTYLPIQSSAGHYNGSYVHVMSLHHFQLDYVVRPTLSLRRRRRKKSDVGRLWLFFRARRLQFAAVCPHLFPLSLACFHRISPLRRARAFDRSVTGERCSTMFDRYTSYSRYI